MKRVIIFIFFLSSINAFGQREIGSKGFIYKKGLSFGIRVPTQGWAIFADIDKFVTVNHRKLIQFEFQELKYSKEYKELGKAIANSNAQTPKPFFFGKQNNFYAIHGSIGGQKLLAERGEKSAVELRVVYLAGVALGILKPYYLYINPDPNNPTRESPLVLEKYNPDEPEHFLNGNKSYIYGSGGFAKGLNEIKLMPGLHGKIGLNFDWATYDEFIKAVEVGFLLDIYAKRVPIMIVDDNKQFFAHLYFSIQFGKRW